VYKAGLGFEVRRVRSGESLDSWTFFRANSRLPSAWTAFPLVPEGLEAEPSWRMTCILVLRKMGGDMQKRTRRRSTHLEEAIALLIQTQAAFVAQLAENSREIAESRRKNEKTFSEINRKFAHIEAMLMRHERILTDLPEVIRQKIGFQPS
jgi:hypothetical protein